MRAADPERYRRFPSSACGCLPQAGEAVHRQKFKLMQGPTLKWIAAAGTRRKWRRANKSGPASRPEGTPLSIV